MKDKLIDIDTLVRPNISALTPYSSARDEYAGHEAHTFLDANESPYNAPYNRYPDPLQAELKAAISTIKGVPADNIFLGNGSDEAIDLLFRAFCEPRRDNVVAIEPTYGMYAVCAQINDVEYRRVRLTEDFGLLAEDLLAAVDEHTKIIFLCSPNNPVGNLLDTTEIDTVVNNFDGIVVLDEAYIDFCPEKSFLQRLAIYPNVVILQTLSKAYASAGIRLGMAFAQPTIINVFNKIKYPYNVNILTQQQALIAVKSADEVKKQVATILAERERMRTTLLSLSVVRFIYPSDANFLLCKVEDANTAYNYLVRKGIIVRNRSRVAMCEGCLRITIGTQEENNELIQALKEYEAS